MKTGKRTSCHSYDDSPIARWSAGSAVRSSGRGSQKTRLRATAAWLATLLVGLLLDILLCLFRMMWDDAPGDVISSSPTQAPTQQEGCGGAVAQSASGSGAGDGLGVFPHFGTD
jgi:hypothetical protein